MKYTIALWLTMCMTYSAYSQFVTVRDIESGAPLEAATLSSNAPSASTTTDKNGRADIAPFRDATSIEIRMLGYEPVIKSFFELEQAQFNVLLLPVGFSLDQVVVSASRWKQSKREIPGKISSISRREVALQQPQTAADLLGTSGEVFIQKSQQGGGSPMIRGFATNRLLIAVDGIRMNTAIFRSGNLQNVISLDPFSIANTEVFFGPGSVIYGSDAIGGVMSFQTILPDFSAGAEALVKGNAEGRTSSANEERTGHFDVQVGWKKWALASSFSHFKYGDLRMGSHGPEDYLRPFYVQRQNDEDVVVENPDPLVQIPTGYSQSNMMHKIRFQPNEKWNFVYGLHHSATTGYSRYDRHIRLRNGRPRSGEWSYGPQIWTMNHLEIIHSPETGLYDQVTLRLAHQFFEESRIDRDINDSERRSRVEKVNAYSANLDFQKLIGGQHQLFYGLEWVHDDINSTGTDENILTDEIAEGPARYPQSTWGSFGGYLSYKQRLSDKMALLAGARYNLFNLDGTFDNRFYDFPFDKAEIDDGALTGSLGFVFHPTEKWALSANASTGFRAPNVDDVGKVFDSEPGSVVVPNPGLKAEYAYNGEIGMAKILGEVAKIDLTFFYTNLQNAMVRRDFQLNGQDSIVYDGALSQIQAIQNAAKAHVYGIQAGLELKFKGGFGLLSKWNFQKGIEELDNGESSPSRHAAPMFGVSHLTWSSAKLKLDFYTQFNAEVSYKNLSEESRGSAYLFAADDKGNPYAPGWVTFNFKAIHQVNEHISVSGGVENITDRRYRPYSSGMAAPGRNVVLALRVGF